MAVNLTDDLTEVGPLIVYTGNKNDTHN